MLFTLPIELQKIIYMYAIESPFILYPLLYEEFYNEINYRKTFNYRIKQSKKRYQYLCKKRLEDKWNSIMKNQGHFVLS
jgi:hypothetical protein